MKPRRIVRLAVAALAVVALGLVAMRLVSLWSLGRIGWYDGVWIEVDADPDAGFHAPYLAYVPASLATDAPIRLWLRPNNSGLHDDPEQPIVEAEKLLAVSRWQAERLRAVVLVPAFPRPADHWRIYTHALDRDAVIAAAPLGRPDLQLLAMADDLARRLGRPTCADVLIDGFSASAMFADRFTLIHPERVAAAVIGAPGGWPMAPLPDSDGVRLPYPAGTADYEALFGRPPPVEAWRETPMLFVLGDLDTNDSLPYEDGYEPDLAASVIGAFGERPVDRWSAAERLHAGLDATFRLDRGVGHEEPRAAIEARLAFLAAHDDRSACARR